MVEGGAHGCSVALGQHTFALWGRPGCLQAHLVAGTIASSCMLRQNDYQSKDIDSNYQLSLPVVAAEDMEVEIYI